MSIPVGTILAYGGNVEGGASSKLDSQGWRICDGSIVNIADYQDLFDVIGSSFGAGNHTTTFSLPDLRGRFLRGVDHGEGHDPDAKNRTELNAGGSTGDHVGSLQADEIASHTHKYTYYYKPKTAHGGDGASYKNLQGDYKDIATKPTGGHETRPKNVYVNWIIRTKDSSST